MERNVSGWLADQSDSDSQGDCERGKSGGLKDRREEEKKEWKMPGWTRFGEKRFFIRLAIGKE